MNLSNFSIRSVNLKANRGKYKNCQICTKEFSLMLKEHQCKRCKRAVCDKCAQHKMVILNYSKSKDPHRVCDVCKSEADALHKFVSENSIQFERDTFSLEWLQSMDMDLDQANKLYQEKASSEMNEYNLFKGQLPQVYQEIQSQMNYSLRDFFSLILGQVDESVIIKTLDKVIGQFLQNYPDVGYSAELIFIGLFLLCFSSEAAAYALLHNLYKEIIPQQLHFRQMRISNYSFSAEIAQILRILQVIKIPTDPIKPFLQVIKNYITTLTMNFFLFETTFFIMSILFQEEGYIELLKALAAAMSLQDYSLPNERIQINMLQNVRVTNLQHMYFETKRYRPDGTAVRSLSIVNQRKSEQKSQDEKLRQDYSIAQQQLQQYKMTIEALTTQLQQQKKEIDSLKENCNQNQSDFKQLQEENSTLVEQNHNLKLSLLSTPSDAKTLDSSQDNYFQNQLQSLQKSKTLLEQQCFNLKQENDVLKNTTNSTQQMAQLVKIKNEQISKLQEQLAEKQMVATQPIVERQRNSSIAQINEVIKDLEDGKNLINKKNQEILQLRQEIALLKEKQPQTLVENNNSLNSGEMEVSEEMMQLLSDSDPRIRTAARNIKQQMKRLHEELLFQSTQAEVRKEQLEPFKQRAESLQKELDFLVEQNKELQIEIEQKKDYIEDSRRKTLQPKMKLRDDKDILQQNNNSCSTNKDCKMF